LEFALRYKVLTETDELALWWTTDTKGSGVRLGTLLKFGLYSGGQGYFTTFLKTLGLLNANKTVTDQQSASYFRLETANWLVLGLDTGYHSGGVPAWLGDSHRNGGSGRMRAHATWFRKLHSAQIDCAIKLVCRNCSNAAK
jgi:hypothetical protein